METLRYFIDVNAPLLAFVYGLAYFSAGLAILLQRRGLSNFRLAHNLWLVGIFFISHGVAKWGDVFIPIQGLYLSESWVAALFGMQKLLWASSFALLLQFGIAMIAPALPLVPGVQTFVRWYGPFWSTAVILWGILFLPEDVGSSWIRYLLTFPATVLTASAFLMERRNIITSGYRRIEINLAVLAAGFGAYAVLGGLVVEERALPLLHWFNHEAVLDFTGFPVFFWRMLISIAIAFFIIRTLSIFDLELRQRLESAEKERALLMERQRIARDLHDGVVQSIYAAGLQLEAAANPNRVGGDETYIVIRRIVDQLNNIIVDLRRYIFGLGPGQTVSEDGFFEYIRNLVYESLDNSGISAEVLVTGEPVSLSPTQRENIAFVARESLSNAVRHSRAKQVKLRFMYEAGSLFFVVEDDGIGIDVNAAASGNGHRGHGLGTMAERTEAMKGELSVSQRSAAGGTMVALRIPYLRR
ncbi:MAG: hypothetical protein IBX61_08155 [Thermoleophilia bacterium]|nr:hypothetical protein [Thermoleophilia bacterium]